MQECLHMLICFYVFLNRFISQLLTLLVCPNEQTSLQIRSGVKESLGVDLSPALFKPFFTLVKATKNCFFLDGQVREWTRDKEDATFFVVNFSCILPVTAIKWYLYEGTCFAMFYEKWHCLNNVALIANFQHQIFFSFRIFYAWKFPSATYLQSTSKRNKDLVHFTVLIIVSKIMIKELILIFQGVVIAAVFNS